METTFEHRLRAAVRAGWWTLLVGAVLVTVQWGLYLAITSRRPAWVLSIWGPDASWQMVERRWLSALITIRVVLFVLAMVVVWGTIWAAALRRRVTSTRADRIIDPAIAPLS
jgi:hypothetical protein